jgi:trehalose/maltose hydrolase-like predicted phosphorylase
MRWLRRAWATRKRYFRETASLDLDLDPNSVGGVRIAALGGLWQAVILGFAGLDLQ